MQSASMRRLDQVLHLVAPKDVAVTLVGESGTGKEILSRRVHELSPRKAGPFVPINCAAIPESLFESELFGHERGAFTGASELVKGKVEAAQGGTLFLDEVGEMPLAMQAKLLRFLENRRFMRVGGSTKLLADVRLIFATLRALDDEVRAGRFRADLFYRIQGITIRVPPLRDRRADIPLLLNHFVGHLAAKHGTAAPCFSRSARAALVSHVWPGNVRELRNVVETLCLLRAGKRVRIRDLPEEITRATSHTRGASMSSALSIDLGQSLECNIERIIEASLALEGGNRARAAERLGVSVRTIQRYLARGIGEGVDSPGDEPTDHPEERQTTH
ncbi:MAG TPA: sigma-54 dependent transcriptional regulator [Polyangiaceae bacterium]|nr:sigma-54 dependent transcriptional regulator [Polyangiaceae bacterium]